MKTLTKLIFLIYVSLFLANYTLANENTTFTSKDIHFIKHSLVSKEDFYKDDGFFIDLKEMEVIDKKTLYQRISDFGTIALFPNQETYEVFIQFLEDIAETPDAFFDKELTYTKDGHRYSITLLKSETGITININSFTPTGVEGFEFSEQSFMYSFEKKCNKVLLASMNVAG